MQVAIKERKDSKAPQFPPVTRDKTIDYDKYVSKEPIDYRIVDPSRLPSDFHAKVRVIFVEETWLKCNMQVPSIVTM